MNNLGINFYHEDKIYDKPERGPIVCLNCRGRGWQVGRGLDYMYPQKCKACLGTGKQEIRD